MNVCLYELYISAAMTVAILNVILSSRAAAQSYQ